MKLFLSLIMVTTLIGCKMSPENGQVASTLLSALDPNTENAKYVGSKNLRAVLFKKRVYVISDLEFLSVSFEKNGRKIASSSTNRENSDLKSWHTDPLNLKSGDLIVALAEHKPAGENRLVLKIAEDLKLLDVSKEYIDKPLPSYPGIKNDVDVVVYMKKFNDYRRSHGLSPMNFSHELTLAASKNNPHQLRAQRSGHFVPVSGAEIAFYGPSSIDAAIRGWHNSQGHRRLMQGGYNCTGIHRQGRAWTQRFTNRANCGDL